MSALYSYPSRPPPMKRRRTATTVLAGNFDPRPPRDVLTSPLKGICPYKRAEQADGTRRQISIGAGAVSAGPSTATTVHGRIAAVPTVNSSVLSFWRIRGPPVAPTRSVSPTPPPELSLPPTPGPSILSTMSFGSSKYPRTPEDGLTLLDHAFKSASPPPQSKPRKRRIASRRGWKGWVEGSPPPSNKLINLDEAPVMVERRLRSGKNFDAISEGKETWVTLSS
ncbi:uncharacterized protein FOMMEDRAFT_24335 [Fomitiporia mediterranea MF3/22]|uniref:Uncharacterized protein n=1 Tax=Fomitiporia mediterranea (strain MF3/22) TaxID=694068 RepID=R7SIZ7_FOMME|nr:uncharacterized protein FOMMEDRAFT_24335 [Fomitiporia mediterranea MF3/22]EJC97594.1 hypothetical protein FOMMEDRAFT_24335 [Fomitiporia mediterranea MF3/22]